MEPRRGTPPRMRGRLGELVAGVVVPGNTPAYAGKLKHFSGRPADFGNTPAYAGKHFTTSAFAGRNPILASLRATSQHYSRRVGQVNLGWYIDAILLR